MGACTPFRIGCLGFSSAWLLELIFVRVAWTSFGRAQDLLIVFFEMGAWTALGGHNHTHKHTHTKKTRVAQNTNKKEKEGGEPDKEQESQTQDRKV